MGKGVLLPLLMATSLALGALAQVPAGRHDPHRGAVPGSEASTPVVSGEPGCDLVVDYYRDLNRALFRADAFFDFLSDDTIDFGDVTPEEGEAIIASGDELIADLEQLDVPGAYAEGNEGIINLMQVNVDLVNFYALDSSNVPDITAFDDSLLQIYDGEIALAEACPDEVDEIGGYMFYDPEEIEQDLNIGN